jgi:hypothetical protein
MNTLTFPDSDRWETRDFDDVSSEEATEDATEETTDEGAEETATIEMKGKDYVDVGIRCCCYILT